MAPILYGTLVSPPVRSVLLTEAALGIKLDFKELNLAAEENFKPEYVKLNPQHTVPFLIDDDGTKVCDSHAIMAYLVTKYGKDDKLYPKDRVRRADVDYKLHFDSGCTFALLRRIALDIKLKRSKFADPICKELAEDNYGFLNIFLEGKKWVCGDSLTIADFSLLTTVTSLDVVVPINAKYSNIINWIKRAEQTLPYYKLNKEGVIKVHELAEYLRGLF